MHALCARRARRRDAALAETTGHTRRYAGRSSGTALGGSTAVQVVRPVRARCVRASRCGGSWTRGSEQQASRLRSATTARPPPVGRRLGVRAPAAGGRAAPSAANRRRGISLPRCARRASFRVEAEYEELLARRLREVRRRVQPRVEGFDVRLPGGGGGHRGSQHRVGASRRVHAAGGAGGAGGAARHGAAWRGMARGRRGAH